MSMGELAKELSVSIQNVDEIVYEPNNTDF